jgi:hypothetical protein
LGPKPSIRPNFSFGPHGPARDSGADTAGPHVSWSSSRTCLLDVASLANRAPLARRLPALVSSRSLARCAMGPTYRRRKPYARATVTGMPGPRVSTSPFLRNGGRGSRRHCREQGRPLPLFPTWTPGDKRVGSRDPFIPLLTPRPIRARTSWKTIAAAAAACSGLAAIVVW